MAVTAPQDRIAGFQGAVYFGSNKILDIFDWTLEANQEVVPCGIKGEVHEQYVAGMVTSRITAQRFVTDVATNLVASPTNEQGGSVFGQNLGLNIPASANSPHWTGLQVNFTLWSVDSVTTSGFHITGTGFITRVTANNPRGSVTEALEIQSNAMPVWSN